MESIYICGGGSAVPGVGPRLLQDISAHLVPSMQPLLCPALEYMPEHTGKRPGHRKPRRACTAFRTLMYVLARKSGC